MAYASCLTRLLIVTSINLKYVHMDKSLNKEFELCGNRGQIKTVSGIITHTHQDSPVSCSITFLKPVGYAHRYAVIEGLSESMNCPDYNLTTNIGRSFCASEQGLAVLHLNGFDMLALNATGYIPTLRISVYFTGEYDVHMGLPKLVSCHISN